MLVLPGTGALVFLIGGVSTLATFTAFRIATKAGPELTLTDLLPAPPWVGLPLPRFLYEKPELLAELRR